MNIFITVMFLTRRPMNLHFLDFFDMDSNPSIRFKIPGFSPVKTSDWTF